MARFGENLSASLARPAFLEGLFDAATQLGKAPERKKRGMFERAMMGVEQQVIAGGLTAEELSDARGSILKMYPEYAEEMREGFRDVATMAKQNSRTQANTEMSKVRTALQAAYTKPGLTEEQRQQIIKKARETEATIRKNNPDVDFSQFDTMYTDAEVAGYDISDARTRKQMQTQLEGAKAQIATVTDGDYEAIATQYPQIASEVYRIASDRESMLAARRARELLTEELGYDFTKQLDDLSNMSVGMTELDPNVRRSVEGKLKAARELQAKATKNGGTHSEGGRSRLVTLVKDIEDTLAQYGLAQSVRRSSQIAELDVQIARQQSIIDSLVDYEPTVDEVTEAAKNLSIQATGKTKRADDYVEEARQALIDERRRVAEDEMRTLQAGRSTLIGEEPTDDLITADEIVFGG